MKLLRNVKILNKQAIFENKNTLYNYAGNRGFINMRKFTKKLSAITLCAMFASMQIAAATDGLGNSTITGFTGGMTSDSGLVGNTRTLEFNNNAHVQWNTLNVANGETLNFNAVNGANNLTVLNTVANGMTKVYGSINANSGIGKLIISNPNGMLFDGANFAAAGEVQLTTQPMTATFNGTNMAVSGLATPATEGISINGGSFNVGKLNLVAPTIQAANAAITAGNGVKFTTANGQDYLVSTVDNNASHQAVRLESVNINGDVVIASGKDIVNMVKGGTINGNLDVQSQGKVAMNYVNDGEQLHVTGNVNANNDGRYNFLKNAQVDGNLNMSNSGGYLEVENVTVNGDANLTTTVASNAGEKHFVHVYGDTTVNGDLNIDSIHNIHVGGYDKALGQFLDGSLNVGGDMTALAREGSVAVTVDTTAGGNMSLESGTLNVITDGQAQLTAKEYQFKANRFIGGIARDEDPVTYRTSNIQTGQTEWVTSPKLIAVMENYTPLPNVTKMSYIKVNGQPNALGHNAAHITKLETTVDPNNHSYARIQSNGDMHITGINSDLVTLSAPNANIQIDGPCPPVAADYAGTSTAGRITIDPATNSVRAPFAARNYELKFKNIKDNEYKTIDPATEITYGITDGQGGNNDGTQVAGANTRLIGPDAPVVPPTPQPQPQPDPVNPTPNLQDNDNVKVLNNLGQDQVSRAIAMDPVAAPIAFAADLDDEIDTGVRKNVDGSVTVVRPYIPTKK